MTSLRNVLRRNRGLIAALMLVWIAHSASFRIFPTRPRVSWAEVTRPSAPGEGPKGRDFGLFAPDGRAYFSADAAGLRVRDLQTGQVRELCPGEPKDRDRFIGARFLDGGRFLVGGLSDPDPSGPNVHSVRIWETSSAREWVRILATREWVRILAIGDGSVFSTSVVSADDSTYACPPRYDSSPGDKIRPTTVWKPAWGQEVRTFAGADPIALSGDGRFLAAGGPGTPMTAVLIYDVDSRKRVATIPVGPGLETRFLAISRDGKILAEALSPGTILWDVATATRLTRLETTEYPIGFAVGDSVLMLGPSGSPSEFWDLSIKPPRLIYRGMTMHTSPDGRRLIQSGPAWAGSPAIDGSTELLEAPWVFDPKRDGGAFESDSPREMEPKFSPDGRLAAIFGFRTEPSPLGMHWQSVPAFLQRALAPCFGDRLVGRIRVLHTRTRERVAMAILPDRLLFMPPRGCQLVEDGKTLAIRYTLEPDPGGGHAETHVVELWDVPPQFPWWRVAAGLGLVAVGMAFDLWARKWGSMPFPAPTRTRSDASP